jgi:hypothetical protein
MTSYRVEIQEREDGPWTPNGVRYATAREAQHALGRLAMSWFGFNDIRVTECEGEANYRWAVVPARIEAEA